MKAQHAVKARYTVFCWDGFQRGHIGDFARLKEAKGSAADACSTGVHGEEFYVVHNADARQVALFLPDYEGEVSVQRI